MVPVGRMGILILGYMTLSRILITGGQQGQNEVTESPFVDSMLQTISVKLGCPRSRINPPPALHLEVIFFAPTRVT